MIDILSRRGAEAIDEAGARGALLAFDFDGTLAPLTAARANARMRESTRLLLRAVALVYPTAVISGRARSDVAERVIGAPLVAIVGNHGAEALSGSPPSRIQRRVRRWAAALREPLSLVNGVELEDKGYTLSIHCRRSSRPDVARRRILEAAMHLAQARVHAGHAVVNVCPAELPTKGAAVETLVRRLTAPMAVYVGDDVTDEDAFASPAVNVSIRVGRSDESSAPYFLPRQEDVDALLEALVLARARRARGSRASTKARAGGAE